MSETILVTGATGLVGGALCARLVLEGTRVRALVRRQADLPGVELVRGGLDDEAALASACEGVDVVIHSAARASDVGTLEVFMEDNVHGTTRLLRAAERAGAKRLVFLSTISVHGFTPPPLVDEETACDAPARYPYAVSKVATEAVVRAAAIETVVARVGSVYGPGSYHWSVRPAEIMQKSPRGMLLVEDGTGTHNPIYLDNLVDALLLAARTPAAANQTLLLVDEPLSYRAFFGRYAAMLGQEKFLNLGKTRALALAFVLEKSAALRGRPPLLTRNAVRLLLRRAAMKSDKTRALIGWQPKIDLDEGMARTELWLRENGHLP